MPTDAGAHASGRGAIFDGLAEEYDALRPGYPAELVAEVLRHAALPDDACLLEVGCGSGQATRLFAPAGRRITCVEPSPRMAALAARNLAGHPHVTIENARFEDWAPETRTFDLLYAAQSFHWVDPAIGFTKAADVLRPGGTLALFWNRPVGPPPALRDALEAVYAREAPELLRAKTPRELPWIGEALDQTGRFDPVAVSRFPWTDTRGADAYARLIATYSDHAALPAPQRQRLLDGVRAAIARHGGTIAVENYTLLFLTRTRA